MGWKLNTKSHEVHKKERIRSDRYKIRKKVYRTSAWQNLRKSYIECHPLCECCMIDKKYVPAQVVHHKDSFCNYSNIGDIESKAYDPDNLIALCEKCHDTLHYILQHENKESSGQNAQQIHDIIHDFRKKRGYEN